MAAQSRSIVSQAGRSGVPDPRFNGMEANGEMMMMSQSTSEIIRGYTQMIFQHQQHIVPPQLNPGS
jgi:hypothetical protein